MHEKSKLINKIIFLLIASAGVILTACPQSTSETDAGALIADASRPDHLEADSSHSDRAQDDSSIADSAQDDSSNSDSANLDSSTATEDAAHQIVAACSEINATDCFANMDCPEQQRCQNMGSAELAVPCCVDGTRGQDPVGHSCSMTDGELTCASGLCIEGSAGTLCSGTCSDVSDCPDNMQLCQYIAYSNNNEQWCFPH